MAKTKEQQHDIDKYKIYTEIKSNKVVLKHHFIRFGCETMISEAIQSMF